MRTTALPRAGRRRAAFISAPDSTGPPIEPVLEIAAGKLAAVS